MWDSVRILNICDGIKIWKLYIKDVKNIYFHNNNMVKLLNNEEKNYQIDKHEIFYSYWLKSLIFLNTFEIFSEFPYIF